ncbi:MAG: energy-coupling factor transporter transmembrane component T [Thermoplasmata archaeon]
MDYHINRYSFMSPYKDVHPAVKLIITVFSLGEVSLLKSSFSLLAALIVVSFLLINSHIPVEIFSSFLLITVPFWLFPAAVLLFTEGIYTAVILFTRVFISLSIVFLYASTTSLTGVVCGLQWLKVSPVIIDLIVLTLYAVKVFTDSFSTMTLSLKARGFTGGKSILDRKAMKTLSNAVRTTLVKAYNRTIITGRILRSRMYKAGSLGSYFSYYTALNIYSISRDLFAASFVLYCLFIFSFIETGILGIFFYI